MTVVYESELVKTSLDRVNKTLTVKLSGFASSSGSASFVDLYKQWVSKVHPKDYTLIVDSTDLQTFPPAVLPVLEASYQLYMSSGFKHIMMVNPSNMIAKNQLNRVARNTNYTGVFVNSYDEALKNVSA